MRNTCVAAVCVVAMAALAASADRAFAQSFFRGGTEFNALRQVTVPGGKAYTIVVVEFLHHGEINADGRNVVVAAQNKELVPLRVSQLGPGDFCRLAFQTVKGQTEYGVFYGGPPPRDAPPDWTCRDGLLLETRQFQSCNFRDRDSVRKAFDSAKTIGADYVDSVFHGHNPFTLRREPFLSRYTGSLDLPNAAKYGFFTTSQDCSFLSIDGKLVAAAPGPHGPTHWAFRGTRHDVQLTAARHEFQYDHATASPNATMVAAWEIAPTNPKPSRPVLIPPEVFGSNHVAHLTPGPLAMRTVRQPPDFTAKIVGETPVPDVDIPLVGVQFRENSSKAVGAQVRARWDFGDGQTSDAPNPTHVYLRPGLYSVKLSIRRGGATVETTNRIEVDRPPLPPQDKQHTLIEYLRIVEQYDAKTLDAASLLQLVRVFEAKALALANRNGKPARKKPAPTDAKRPGGKRPAPRKPAETDDAPADEDRYFALAVAAGKAAFAEDSAAKGDADLLNIARLTAPIARYKLGDSLTAGQIWRDAGRRLSAPEAKAECETAAADVAINDLVKAAAAKPLLDAATQRLGNPPGSLASELHRVWGDYYAATGDGRSARKAYLAADRAVVSSRNYVERTAWLGAHARSTEEFLKQKQFVRAIEELRRWQQEFPAEKIDGYWTLLAARYWAGRGKHAQAIAQVEQLQAVNPDSPYLDQLLWLAAESEGLRGRKDRQKATLQSLLKDCPGSPLVPKAKRELERLSEEH